MADQEASAEAEEQIDLGGDNDIEDMMDDEDPAEGDSYRTTRDEYREQDLTGDDGYRTMRDEYREHDPTGDDSYKRSRDEYREHDPTGDDSYKRSRDEYEEHDPVDDDRYRRVRNAYGEQDDAHGFEDEEHDKVSESDAKIDNSGPTKHEEKPVASKDEDSGEHAELLSLPPHGSEVFIGGLPRDVAEEHLRELCEPFGDIFEVRLAKDKEKRESKGFAFIKFTTKDAAQKAIEEIQDKEFRGKTLRCSLSQVKFRLFIGNVPKNLTEEDFRKILDEIGPGVENIECFKDAQNPGRNRGFLFAEYYNHECAEYARKKMSSANFNVDGSTPAISWADPKNVADASAASQVKVLYVKNLPEGVTSEKLKTLFEHHGEITKVVLPPSKSGQNKRDFGFIHFAERSSALKAIKGSEIYEIDGHVIEVVLAKPLAEKKPDYASNFYKSGQSYPQYPSHSYPGDPYGAYSAGYGAGGHGQPVIYGRGPMPSGMRMVPMVLPDGQIGYVLQQPGANAPLPRPSHSSRRSDRGSGDGGDRDGERNRGRRYRPY